MGVKGSKSRVTYMDLPVDVYNIIAGHLDYTSVLNYRLVSRDHATDISVANIRQRERQNIRMLLLLLSTTSEALSPGKSQGMLTGELLFGVGRFLMQSCLVDLMQIAQRAYPVTLKLRFKRPKINPKLLSHGWSKSLYRDVIYYTATGYMNLEFLDKASLCLASLFEEFGADSVEELTFFRPAAVSHVESILKIIR